MARWAIKYGFWPCKVRICNYFIEIYTKIKFKSYILIDIDK